MILAMYIRLIILFQIIKLKYQMKPVNYVLIVK